MLGRFKKACIGLPGGCHIGPRPIDQHIKGFEALGAKVTNEQGAIYLRADELIGSRVYLDVVSVGATINIMLAAVRAKGRTIIENAAKEPEIIDVATLLNNMGAASKVPVPMSFASMEWITCMAVDIRSSRIGLKPVHT